MVTVSNTSPLLNLAIVGRLHLLRQQFSEIWVPRAVLMELRTGEELPGSQAIREALEAGWLRVEEIKDEPFVRLLLRELDQGEAEAIALALQVRADWILLDEREARRIAKSLGLKLTGVLGVLLRARHEGQLPSLREVLQQLQDRAGFYVSSELLAGILEDES